jgi:uncharacterized protein YidB (DUF937 family)
MSAITMAVLGYLAEGIKHLSKSHAAGSAGTPTSSGILVGFSMGARRHPERRIRQLDRKRNGGGGSIQWTGAVLQQFQQNGHAQEANSWVGPGANKDVSEQGLAKSLGEKDINSLSQQTGMSREDLLSALRHELPNIIDQLTPQGRVPAPHEISQQI